MKDDFPDFYFHNKMLRILLEYQKTKVLNRKKRISKKHSKIKRRKECVQICNAWKTKNPQTTHLIL